MKLSRNEEFCKKSLALKVTYDMIEVSFGRDQLSLTNCTEHHVTSSHFNHFSLKLLVPGQWWTFCVCVFIFWMFNAAELLAVSSPLGLWFHAKFPTINWPTVSNSFNDFPSTKSREGFTLDPPDTNLLPHVPLSYFKPSCTPTGPDIILFVSGSQALLL